MTIRKLLFTFLCLGGVLYGITAEYNIKSMGMNFARLSLAINYEKQVISVKAHSVQTGDIVAKLDNSYRITYDKSFRPREYLRQIKQKKLETQVFTRYNHTTGKAIMEDSASGKRAEYHIADDARDIFSFLAYCAQGAAKPGSYTIDANGMAWQANLRRGTREEIKTSLGKFNTTKYLLDFKQLGSGKTTYVDMVTFNLVNAETKLELWISDKGIPLKARVKKGSKTMNWELAALQA